MPHFAVIALLTAAGLSLSLLCWDRPGFLLVNSDTLAAAEFIWDLSHRSGAWTTFQQPHNPEFVPGDLFFGVVQGVTANWRLGMAGWVLLTVLWLLAVVRAIATDIALTSRPQVTLSVLLLIIAVLAAGAVGAPRSIDHADASDLFRAVARWPWFIVLPPVSHGGTLLLALTTALVMHRSAAQPTALNHVYLFLLSLAAQFSDQLSLVFFLAPATAAMLGCVLGGTIIRPRAIRLIFCIWVGAALGGLGSLLFDRRFLAFPNLFSALASGQLFFAELNEASGIIGSVIILMLALGAELWRRGLGMWLGSFWPVFATASAAGSLMVTILFYRDAGAFRYALPLIWWPVIYLAGLLAIPLGRCMPTAWAMTAVVISGPAMVWLTPGIHVPALFTWSTPLATCLRQEGLQTGLAGYWIARQTNAATDWELQVQPIDQGGGALLWGNDWMWFTHDIHDDRRRPAYQFIVMDELPITAIVNVYGRPDRVAVCGGSTIWIYNDPAWMFNRLKHASGTMGPVFAAAPDLP